MHARAAHCLDRLGRRDDALAAARRALAIDPEQAQARRVLAGRSPRPRSK